MGQTVNLLVFTFGGSNPSLPTKRRETELILVSLLFVPIAILNTKTSDFIASTCRIPFLSCLIIK